MKKFILPLVALLIIAGISTVIATKKMSDNKAADINHAASRADAVSETSPVESQPSTTQQIKTAGRYEEYGAEKVAATGYKNTVLFFHAGWCPECRSFKQAITSSEIPEGIQVLEVNYDKATDLKKQHGVTLQSTFVKVDGSGKQLSKWVGYGKNKDLQTVLANL